MIVEQNTRMLAEQYTTSRSNEVVVPVLSRVIYPRSSDLREQEMFPGARLKIPRSYIFGIQPKEEYDNRKAKLAKAAISQGGIKFLEENPIILCAIPYQNGVSLALIDGHHRTRYSGQFGITHMPSLVFSPEAVAEMYNRSSFKPKNSFFTPESLVTYLDQSIGETLHSFRELPDNKQPQLVRGVNSIEQLQERFPSF